MTQAPKQTTLWISVSAIPPPLKTAEFVLEPLAETHAELDYAALMACRARLRRELQWRDWPPEGFTLEENREDLRRHHGEFCRGEAFAYTVLTPDRTRCLGCIYLERCAEIDGAQLAYWVIDDALALEPALVRTVLEWARAAWSIERVLIPLRDANTRGLALMLEFTLAVQDIAEGPLANHRCFLSKTGRDD